MQKYDFSGNLLPDHDFRLRDSAQPLILSGIDRGGFMNSLLTRITHLIV